MGSGSFPLEYDTKDIEKLKEAQRLIDEVANSWWDHVYSGEAGGQQFDNAATDGAYLYRLELAVNLVNECIR